MDVHLSPDLEAKLARIAAQRGCDAEAVARDAIEQLVTHDEWFIGQIEEGLAQVARGDVLTHEEVGARLGRQLAERSRSR